MLFLGIINGVDVDKINPNKEEVDHIFTVPLDFFYEKMSQKYII